MVVDTDVVYSDLLRRLVDAYAKGYAHLSVQTIFCGIFPREQWIRAGGRRSLNTNEDVDLWLRLDRLGVMRWYPIAVGENMKESPAWGQADYLSSRYTKAERLLRLVRREWDFLKTKPVQRVDLQAIAKEKTIDLELRAETVDWPRSRLRQTRLQHIIGFVREFKQAARVP
jgi:hypothetical protein